MRPPGSRPLFAPFADTDVGQVVNRQIRRFNDSRDVNEKQEAARQVLAAATIGHPTARQVIVAAYRTSTVIQGVARVPDVVRLGLDFAALGQGDGSGARSFAALAAHLAARDPAGFGTAMLDALRDDSRLREPRALRLMLDALSGSGAPCAALAAVSGHSGSGCDGALGATLAAQAQARGPAGLEDTAYKTAERDFARYLQDAL